MAEKPKTYLWCDRCRRSYDHEEAHDGLCPVCLGDLRELGRFQAIIRGFMANELSSSDLRLRHKQLIRMIWTRNGMGERFYRALQPDLPYNKFEARVTDFLCEAAAEGKVRFVIPASPLAPEDAYRIEFDDDERFVEELARLFAPSDQPW
jgi:hypothetical protein